VPASTKMLAPKWFTPRPRHHQKLFQSQSLKTAVCGDTAVFRD